MFVKRDQKIRNVRNPSFFKIKLTNSLIFKSTARMVETISLFIIKKFKYSEKLKVMEYNT